MIAMIKKSFIAAATVLLLVISILAEANVVEVAKANPFMLFRNRIAPPPEAIPPAVTIRSPQNNVTYGSHYIALSFGVSRPLLAKWESSLVEITYTLDDQNTQLYDMMKDGGNTPDQSGAIPGIPEYNITLACPFLISGNHRFSVYAEGVGLTTDGFRIFYINSSSTVFFTVGSQPDSTMPSPIPIPQPSVPEFTVKFVQAFYSWTSPQGGTSQYPNNTMEVKIRNQPLTINNDGYNNISLFYLVRLRNAWTPGWLELNSAVTAQSSSVYTVISIPASNSPYFPVNSSVDFQVQAQIGFYYYRLNAVEKSGWSNTQTVALGENTSSPDPYVTPAIPEFPVAIIIAFFVVAAVAFGWAFPRKHRVDKRNVV